MFRVRREGRAATIGMVSVSPVYVHSTIRNVLMNAELWSKLKYRDPKSCHGECVGNSDRTPTRAPDHTRILIAIVRRSALLIVETVGSFLLRLS
jgi:hypothetical protein